MTDEKFTLYDIYINDDLKPGDYVQLKCGKDIISQYRFARDEGSCVERYKLVPTILMNSYSPKEDTPE